jgi:transcriptional regulator with XRE-family HTH domain
MSTPSPTNAWTNPVAYIGTGILDAMVAEHYSRHLIRIARRRAGLTQEALARRAATSQSALSAYESGRRSPSVATLARILEAAGFELRMRLSEPDTHDATRRIAERLLPPDQLDAFTRAEQGRSTRARRSKAVGA